MYSPTTQDLILVELTYKSRTEEHVFKSAKYNDLIQTGKTSAKIWSDCIRGGGKRIRGDISVGHVQKQLGIKGEARTEALKSLAETAEKASCWIRHKRGTMEH